MGVIKLLDTKAGMVVAIGAVGAVALYFAEKKVREGAAAVGQSINPANSDNIFYSGVNYVGATLSGDEHWNLGGWIYNGVNGSPEEQAERQKEQNFINSIGG